jgi:hypothetical protein
MVRQISALLALASLSALQQAGAQDVLENVYICAKQLDPQKRLACFDKAIAPLNVAELPSSLASENQIQAPVGLELNQESTSVNNSHVVIKDEKLTEQQTLKVQMAEEKLAAEKQISEQAAIEQFGRQQVEKKPVFLEDGQLHSSIKRIFKSNNRKTRFELANGQIWENQETRTTGFPREGDDVILRREALGAFYVRKANVKRSFRVKRISQ